jgi:hypothetical protein
MEKKKKIKDEGHKTQKGSNTAALILYIVCYIYTFIFYQDIFASINMGLLILLSQKTISPEPFFCGTGSENWYLQNKHQVLSSALIQ